MRFSMYPKFYGLVNPENMCYEKGKNHVMEARTETWEPHEMPKRKNGQRAVDSEDDVLDHEAIRQRVELLRAALVGGYSGSQAEMARRLGFSTNRWNNYESGSQRITIIAVMKLVNAFPGVTMDWIYRGSPSGMSKEIWDRIQAAEPPRKKVRKPSSSKEDNSCC